MGSSVYSAFGIRWFHFCCHKGEHPTIVVQHILTSVRYKDVLCIVNVQHNCYSCKCNKIQHGPVQQEHEMTGNTRALVDHDPEARFVINIHLIHNYKLIAAVIPQDLLVPFTSVNGDVIALRKKAAGLVRGEKQGDNDNAAQPTNDDPLPFDRGGTKGLATAGPNTIFKGTLSTQTKLELTKMASVLGIQVSEKDQKLELASKVWAHLEANQDVRNSVQFTQLTWRSNRKATASPETAGMSSHCLSFSYCLHISWSPCRWSTGIWQWSRTITIIVFTSRAFDELSYDAMVSVLISACKRSVRPSQICNSSPTRTSNSGTKSRRTTPSSTIQFIDIFFSTTAHNIHCCWTCELFDVFVCSGLSTSGIYEMTFALASPTSTSTSTSPSPRPPFTMSLFRDLRNSRASTSSNTDPTSTPATARSITQSGSILHQHRDSNDFEYGLDDILTRSSASTFPITPGAKKHLKTSCDDVAHRYDVDVDELKVFAEVCSILTWAMPSIYTFSPWQSSICFLTWRHTPSKLRTRSKKNKLTVFLTCQNSRHVCHFSDAQPFLTDPYFRLVYKIGFLLPWCHLASLCKSPKSHHAWWYVLIIGV